MTARREPSRLATRLMRAEAFAPDLGKRGAAVLDVGITRSDSGVVGDGRPRRARGGRLPRAVARRYRSDEARDAAGQSGQGGRAHHRYWLSRPLRRLSGIRTRWRGPTGLNQQLSAVVAARAASSSAGPRSQPSVVSPTQGATWLVTGPDPDTRSRAAASRPLARRLCRAHARDQPARGWYPRSPRVQAANIQAHQVHLELDARLCTSQFRAIDW